jgi:hypothetical protein
MAALRHDTDNRLKPLSERADMALIGGARATDEGDDAWLKFLQDNPVQAHSMGRIVKRLRSNMQKAYPGETREREYSNEHWSAAGYDQIARENELLGLDGR